MRNKQVALMLSISAVLFLQGCASTYGNLTSGSNLGAQEYRPSVLVKPGKDEQYGQILGLCRNVAVNRQVTAAQEAQLKTITGVTKGATGGLSSGLQMANIFKQAGFDNASYKKGATIGAAAGAISALGNAFASGTEDTASETKKILLGCLRTADPSGEFYRVLE
jgi:hypothetical protein